MNEINTAVPFRVNVLYRVELERDDASGIWSAVIPALPGCAVDAGSKTAALSAIRGIAQAYIEVLEEGGAHD